MPAEPPPWTRRSLAVLLPLTAVVGVTQYILGLLTNVYAPSSGFNSNTDFGYLSAHFFVGLALGILTIVVVIITVLSRQMRWVGPAVIGFLGVLVAGIAGMSFVNTVPNPPTASLAMGIAFLVAFGALTQLGFSVRSPAPSGGPPGTAGPGMTPSTPSG